MRYRISLRGPFFTKIEISRGLKQESIKLSRVIVSKNMIISTSTSENASIVRTRFDLMVFPGHHFHRERERGFRFFFLLPGGITSESEGEMDGEHNQVDLPQSMPGRGNVKSQQSAIRLHELGPRLTLQLVKVREMYYYSCGCKWIHVALPSLYRPNDSPTIPRRAE